MTPSDLVPECANFRDVGEWVNLIAGETLLPPNRLLRSGKIDRVTCPAHIGSPGTILNLRAAPDPDAHGANRHHLPRVDNGEVYQTTRRDVRAWLRQVVTLFTQDDLRFPVLIHCFAGRDRTGVAVAALLRILNVPDDIIVEEYRLTDDNPSSAHIRQALDGIGDPTLYSTLR